MAVQWNTKHNSTQEWRFLPQDIVIKPALNGRHVAPNIEGLIQDILLNGQHTPVVIRKDGGKPVLCAGFSRYQAVSEINRRKLTPVPMQLRCTYSQCTEEEGFLLAISENRYRNATTELDDAYNIKLLMKKFNMTEEQIAAQYFPAEMNPKLDLADPVVAADRKRVMKWIGDRALLLNLSPEAEKALLAGRLKGSAALKIAKLSQDQQREIVDAAPKGKIKPPPRPKQMPLVRTGKGLVKTDIITDALNEWRAMNNHGLSDQEAMEELCSSWRNARYEDTNMPNWKRAKQLMAAATA